MYISALFVQMKITQHLLNPNTSCVIQSYLLVAIGDRFM